MFNLDCSLRELVTEDGSWNMDMFQIWLPDEIIKCIVSIRPLQSSMGRNGLGLFLGSFLFKCLSTAQWRIMKFERWCRSFWDRKGFVCFFDWNLKKGFLCKWNEEGNWVCLNTDDAMKIDSGLATAGGTIRDRHGGWILGYNRNLGRFSIFNAEL
ncbi:hypothetical protein Gotur_007170 [Gossypium turneri]